MSFWEHHLPWALLKVLQTIPKIKREGPPARFADRGHVFVCLKDVRNDFGPNERLSSIAAIYAG